MAVMDAKVSVGPSDEMTDWLQRLEKATDQLSRLEIPVSQVLQIQKGGQYIVETDMILPPHAREKIRIMLAAMGLKFDCEFGLLEAGLKLAREPKPGV